MNHCFRVTTLVVALATPLSAQAPQPPAQPPATKPPAPPTGQRSTPRAAAPAGSGSSLAVQVTDKSGNGIADVAVGVSGPVERSGRTAADGSISFRSMRVGTYRLRFEHEGFVTLERELMVGTRASDVSVALNPAPPPPKVVAAPPPPVAPPPAQPLRAVEPRNLSLIAFVEKNLIGSEPQKTSLLACTDGGTARILQVKDPMNNQVNNDADQVLYVIAGSGIVRVRDQDYKATPGWFVLIPRGAPLGARRDGRNPLITLTVAMGAACADTAPLAR
jgi:mannose-6-phosphate isomerase-like protein (cupin superfamily)